MLVAPAGAKGTINRTGRDGYVCAIATCGRAGSTAAPAARCRNCRRGSFIKSLSEYIEGPRAVALAANEFQNEKGLPAAGTNAADKSKGDFFGTSLWQLDEQATLPSESGLWQVLAQNVRNGCPLSFPQLGANRTRCTQSEFFSV